MTTKKTTNKLGIVFGRKISDMKEAIKTLEGNGLDVWVITWDGLEDNFTQTTYTQPNVQKDGMDCMNAVLKSAELLFKKVGKKSIHSIANCHTIPTIWDFDLTTAEWKELFNIDWDTKDYVDDVIRAKYGA